MIGRRRRGRPAPLAILAALVAAAIGAGCGGPAPPTARSLSTATASPTAAASPTGATSTDIGPSRPAGVSGDLLLLSGRPGALALELVAADGRRRPVPMPDPDAAWISADEKGQVLVTTRAGRAFMSGPISDVREPSWRAFAVDGAGPQASPHMAPISFGVLSPDGRRAAFLAADFGTSRGFELLVVDAVAGGATAIPIARPAEGAPPSWIDHRVVVLTRERADGAGVTIVDPDGGNAVDGPGPVDGTGPTPPNAGWTGRIAGLALSADGSTVAVAAVGDSRIGIAPAGQWLARQPVALAAGPPATGADGGGSFAWLALSRDGSRLAVVRTDIDGDATGVTVHAGADDWQTEAPIALPAEANRAVVAWLP